MRYALLIYNDPEIDRRTEEQRQVVRAAISEVLQRPSVTSWLRLQTVESSTTARTEQGRTLVTDGPFVDSKDYLGGFIVVEAEDLDEALAVVEELQVVRCAGAIEIRPVLEESLVGP